MREKDMKRMKLFGTGALAVCALSLAVLPVSSASAAKDVLQLNEGETKAANEAPASLDILIATCISRNHGHLTGNDLATVTQVTTDTEDGSCSENHSITGSITKASLSSKGKFSLTGSLTVTKEENEEAGPCEYLFSKWKLTAKAPGPVNIEANVTGKLVKAASNKDCAKTETKTITVGLEDSLEPFNAVLVP
jgi:hypothetical protein